MEQYKKQEPKDSIVTVRISNELKKKLIKLNLNLSKICRDALEDVGLTLGVFKK
jgi:hypothetical protein